MNVSVSVVNDKVIILNKSLADAKGGKSVRVKAVKGGQYLLAEDGAGVGPENITVKRAGNNLHMALEGSDPDQPELIIENFFGSDSQLVGLGEDGLHHEYIAADGDTDSAAAFLMEGMSSPLALGSPRLVGFGEGLVFAGAGLLPWALAGIAGLVGGAIVEHNKGGDNKPKDITAPENKGIGSIVDDKGPLTGSINPGDVTDDNRPTLGGSGQAPGDKVVVIDNGQIIGEVIVDGDGRQEYTLSSDVVFAFGKAGRADISAEGRSAIAAIAIQLKQDGVGLDRIDVVGHTDPIGGDAANETLGMLRAQTVRQMLVESGLSVGAIAVHSKGHRELLVDNCAGDREQIIACNSPNRRVVILAYAYRG